MLISQRVETKKNYFYKNKNKNVFVLFSLLFLHYPTLNWKMNMIMYKSVSSGAISEIRTLVYTYPNLKNVC